MKGILAIYRREIGSFFVSPIAYVVIGLFLVISGIFFYFTLAGAIQWYQGMQMQAMRSGMPPEVDLANEVLRSFINTTATIILFLAPILTMGVYAEERRRGTMEMLMTSPISEFQIVVGKFLAAFTLFLIMIAPTLLYQLIVRMYSDPPMPWKIVLTSYLGLVLLGATLIAIGCFISSLTESQIVAAAITFVVSLILWLLNAFVGRSSNDWLSQVGQYLSILQHHDDFAKGVIDTTNIIYYISMILLALFLTHRSLDSMRWRRA